MTRQYSVARAVRLALAASALPAGLLAGIASAQNAPSEELTEVIVSGTRITVPGVTSSSPIYSVTAGDIQQMQQPEVERIFRMLPITLPSDGQNRNNGTSGAATIDLRGLGAQRNLLLMDGKRITPFDLNGRVDTSVIPTALIERIDIVTGGASAVYGSDAMSGAINFIMKRDFEGLALDTDFSRTGESDGTIKSASLTWGANVGDERGNFVLGINWSERDAVLLGARPLGQLGIVTASGAGLANFLGGIAPTPAPAGCTGENSVAAGGSTTTVPTRAAIAGGPGLGQFREDGTLGANCGVFNFNPYNYYQTPQTRFGGTALGHFSLNERAEVYGRLSFTHTSVEQQVAPSGIFGNPYWTPLANPFISAQARTSILATANAGRSAAAPTVTAANWRDLNTNGVVDAPDDLLISYRRRTVELGARSEAFRGDYWTMQLGVQGAIGEGWDYDFSMQRGQTNRLRFRGGYTNVANIENAVNAVSTTQCRGGQAGCVPINLFGGQGSITPQMAAYARANALRETTSEQTVIGASVSGEVPAVKTPWAERSLALSFGAEYREEKATDNPDDCLQLQPDSCLGGAGGVILPVDGGFDVNELFAEAILPIVQDKKGLQSLDLEMGYRYSDYNPTGANRTWKYGLSYRPVDSLLVRAMKQRAARAPNIGEIATPVGSALVNAQVDPCSIENAANITAALRQRCIGTGMTAAQVGTVEDIVAGQINAFAGTDFANLPKPEIADTLTVGFVWTPQLSETILNPIVSLDYYDVEIQDFINLFGAQEVLDGCYQAGRADQCAKVIRVGGTLTLPGSGISLLTENLKFLRAEGLELGLGFGVDIGSAGKLRFQTNLNKYLTQESQSADFLPVIDCKGIYGNQCGNPLPEVRWIQRATWQKGPWEASLLWRHLGSTDIETAQVAGTFADFRSIAAFDYFDLSAAWKVSDNLTVRLSAVNITDEQPPVVGNEAGSTSTNSGNTFPAVYDTLGRVFSLGVNVKF